MITILAAVPAFLAGAAISGYLTTRFIGKNWHALRQRAEGTSSTL